MVLLYPQKILIHSTHYFLSFSVFKKLIIIIINNLIMTNQIVVITATTGAYTLHDTIQSIQNQTYHNIKHVIVCDGEIYEESVNNIVSQYKDQLKPIVQITIPWQTGKNDWLCHRIYSSIPQLIVEDAYISFLDEDNWVDDDHYSILYETIKRKSLDWVYSLRKVYSREKEFIDYDLCESLGYLSYVWKVIHQLNNDEEYIGKQLEDSAHYYLVDTNCYLIRKEVIIKHSYLFQRPARCHPEADRLLFYELWKNYKGECTMSYTMNYRTDSRRGNDTDSVLQQFFVLGNSYMNYYYQNNIPWRPNDYVNKE